MVAVGVSPRTQAVINSTSPGGATLDGTLDVAPPGLYETVLRFRFRGLTPTATRFRRYAAEANP